MINQLDRWRRGFAYQIAVVLSKTSVTPNQITWLRFVLAAPLSWFFFSRGDYLGNVVGLAVYIGLAIFDWVDGELARLTQRTSALGKFLDDTLDHIVTLIVLTSFIYAGLHSAKGYDWSLLALFFWASYFFQTVLLTEFDQLFGIDFDDYPEIGKKMSAEGSPVAWQDRLLFSLIYVHQSSLSKFVFSISYPLFLGIAVNQLFPTFIFLTGAMLIRSLGVLVVMYRTLRDKPDRSPLIKVLRSLKDSWHG